MNEAEALAGLRRRFPGWAVSVDRGVWRASGPRLIWASSPVGLEAAMNGEVTVPDGRAARRVRVRAHSGVRWS